MAAADQLSHTQTFQTLLVSDSVGTTSIYLLASGTFPPSVSLVSSRLRCLCFLV